jgi:hypothetical protein
VVEEIRSEATVELAATELARRFLPVVVGARVATRWAPTEG